MQVKWLEGAPGVKSGVTFGLPWKQGVLTHLSHFRLNQYPVQSWPMAFWPDGSIKWTAHATVIDKTEEKEFNLIKDDTSVCEDGITISETDTEVMIDIGCLKYSLAKSGHYLIKRIVDRDGSLVARDGQVVAVMEEGQLEGGQRITTEQVLVGEISKLVIERKGPLQVTVKIKGVCGEQNECPFTIRLIFYYQLPQIKVIHTFFYNGNPDQHFIKGLGLELSTKLTGSPYNRHIRLATKSGIYNEPAQLLASRRFRQSDLYRKQIDGEIVQPTKETEAIFNQAKGQAVWQDFKFTQTSYQGGRFRKRTSSKQAWVDIPTINQTRGLLYVGGENGGISIGLKDFNEKYPSQLGVRGVAKDLTTLSIWFWSPDQEAMDLRHYSNETHVKSAYEGFDEMRATPVGIANTSEAYLTFFASHPSKTMLFDLAHDYQKPSLLISDPKYYYESGATGIWPLKEMSNPKIKYLEEQLDQLLLFYQREIEQRHWYGYWNYGDIMHTYDATRKQWFYDMGGYAWQNTELVPNLWLWYSFFRTGNPEIFRLIEAMTRHNSEVDRYHFGEYKGLGSRHNVSHWGCGCKEVRISMACLYKYYYYLTADERMLDLLDEVKDADQTLDQLDPMREHFPEEVGLTHARVGPDWVALSSNWMSRWERTGERVYLEKILTGLNTLKKMPHRLLTGPTYCYDTRTSELIPINNDEGSYHMVIAFGAPQVWLELADLLNDEAFKDMIAEFGQVYAMSEDEKLNFFNGQSKGDYFHWPMFASGLIAYAASRFDDQELGKQAWQLLLNESLSDIKLPVVIDQTNSWETLDEIPWVTTNTVSQWGLNVLMCLRFIPDQLDETFPSQ
ncbi:hypothetical protein KQI76_01410 [Amphibacillus sp. MSJ-3]|uniref:exo-rhamnogalacturonan lyase family protein n=1 Tax=Amphibacillus sp. MSJ-3 TaxID=2841505 RepID=UPI001C0EE66E|nr:hypothetical protein [Amphibacillus sp. MSJ-3]MBU5593815.1 hypothetical protein [Amphibacillus sp. MSJ-3]